MEAVLHFASPDFENSSYYYCRAWNEVEAVSVEVIFDVYPIGSAFVDKGFEAAGTMPESDENGDPSLNSDGFEMDLIPQGVDDTVTSGGSPHPGIIAVAAILSILVTCIGLAVGTIVVRVFLRYEPACISDKLCDCIFILHLYSTSSVCIIYKHILPYTSAPSKYRYYVLVVQWHSAIRLLCTYMHAMPKGKCV